MGRGTTPTVLCCTFPYKRFTLHPARAGSTAGTMDGEVRRDAEGRDGGIRIGTNSDALKDEAFVTMVTSDDFVIGAEVMLHSLRKHGKIIGAGVGRRRPLVVMVTPGVSTIKRQALETIADDVIEVCFRMRKMSTCFGCLLLCS